MHPSVKVQQLLHQTRYARAAFIALLGYIGCHSEVCGGFKRFVLLLAKCIDFSFDHENGAKRVGVFQWLDFPGRLQGKQRYILNWIEGGVGPPPYGWPQLMRLKCTLAATHRR